MAGPVLAGSLQVTSRLLPEPVVAVTLGADGLDGGSATSWILIINTNKALAPWPSSIFTITEYMHLVGGSPLVVSGAHFGSSKSSPERVFTSPFESMLKRFLLGPWRL